MAAVAQRFHFTRAENGCAGPLADKFLTLNVKTVQFPHDDLGREREGSNLPHVCHLGPTEYGAARRERSAVTRAASASLPWQAGRSVVPCFDWFCAILVETDGEDLVLSIWSLPAPRQLGQATGRVSWKRRLSGRMSATAIPCVRDEYPKGEDPRSGASA